MGYILDLRKYVSKAPIIMACAGVILINEKGEILLQKRKDNGMWAYPGGSMELGESFEQCAERELKEETGLVAEELVYFTHVSGEEVHYIYPNGDEIYAAEIVFLCRKYSGEIVSQEEECIEHRFFKPAELPEDITPNNRYALKRFAEECAEKHKKEKIKKI